MSATSGDPKSRRFLLKSIGLAAMAGAAGLSLLPKPAWAQVPPTPTFGPAIDGYQPYVGQGMCYATAQPGVDDFRNLLKATYGRADLGITRGCNQGGQSEHKEGRALDYPFNAFGTGEAAQAAELLHWLLATDQYGNPHALARRLGIMYMIWNRQIWEAYRPNAGWQSYTGPDPHTNHIHFSFGWPGAHRQTTWWSQSGGEYPGGIYHRIRNAEGTGWSNFLPLAGAGTTQPAKGSDVAIAGMPDGSAHVVIVGADGGFYHQIRNAQGTGWSGFLPLMGGDGSQIARGSRVSAAGMPDGSLQVVVVGADGVIYSVMRRGRAGRTSCRWPGPGRRSRPRAVTWRSRVCRTGPRMW
ncbi:hypothetical protein [Nonomuraea candida]|uniref:hypothetical protein n=1 Tax=Nonomuraea candida TaxID=359159 RepID=UPI0005B90F0B|nr:hypothetical protein [Nonomuraea candida]